MLESMTQPMTQLASQRIDCLRHLQTADMEEIWGLLQQIYTEPEFPIGGSWTKSLLARELELGYGVARLIGGAVRAFILFQKIPTGVWEISVLGTEPQFRRQGLMKDLILDLLALRPPGVELWLEVHEENTAAITLYRSLGASEVGRRHSYYRDKKSAILMAWPGVQTT